jgi:hypothetical protein
VGWAIQKRSAQDDQSLQAGVSFFIVTGTLRNY